MKIFSYFLLRKAERGKRGRIPGRFQALSGVFGKGSGLRSEVDLEDGVLNFSGGRQMFGAFRASGLTEGRLFFILG